MSIRKSVPQRCIHKGSGQVYLKVNGRRIYCGKTGTAADRRYDEEIRRWQAQQESPRMPDVRVGELALFYQFRHVQKHYIKNDRPTSEQDIIKAALRFLTKYRRVLAADFGPLRLKETRERMVNSGLSRETANRYTKRIRQMFEWAMSEEVIPLAVFESLKTVKALLAGRTKAPDYDDVKPVPARHVFAIKSFLNRYLWAMVKFQLRTGCRPGEAVIIRTCDIDMSNPVWVYRPYTHKMEHKNIPRVVEIGPRAQRILRPFLRPNQPDTFVFSPREAEIERGRTPDDRHRERYDVHSYRRAVQRACRRADVPIWFPNQLRHVFGTRTRKQANLETSRILLGHASVVTTEEYAEPDRTQARDTLAKIG